MDFLKGKAKLAYEAFTKIEQGKKLVREGEIELASLIPEGKLEILPIIAAKRLTRPIKNQKPSRQPSRSIEEVCRIIMKNLETYPAGLSPHWFKIKFGLNTIRIREAEDRLIKFGDVTIVQDGKRKTMVKVKRPEKK